MLLRGWRMVDTGSGSGDRRLAAGGSIEHPDQQHLKHHPLASQRVIEVEQHRAIFAHLQRRARVVSQPVGRGELHHVAGFVLLVRVAQLVEQLARHPLHHLGLALAKRLAGGQLDHMAAALFQPDQALLDRRRELARTQAERGGLATESVNDHRALRSRHAVVQREKRSGLNLGHEQMER